MRLIFIALMLGLLTTAAHAQAFGTQEGMALEDFSQATPGQDGAWIVVPPTPNRSFDGYSAYIGPNIGLCSIAGEASFKTPDEGTAFIADLRNTLVRLYGQPVEEVSQRLIVFSNEAGTAIRIRAPLPTKVFLAYDFRPFVDCVEDSNSKVDPTGL